MAPSIYDNETAEALRTRIAESEERCEAFTEERSKAEKNARALRKQISEMQTVLLRKLSTPTPASKK